MAAGRAALGFAPDRPDTGTPCMVRPATDATGGHDWPCVVQVVSLRL